MARTNSSAATVSGRRLPHPPLFRAPAFRLALKLFTDTDIRATDEQLASFRRFAQVGDPLADALVAEMRALPTGQVKRQFEQALTGGIATVDDPTPALAAFFDQIESVPAWVDPDKLVLAARTMTRTGVWGVIGPLPDVALIGGYLAFRPIKVLMRTGDLDRRAPARAVETATWWVQITTPGGLSRGHDGFVNIARVRLIHAHIRAAMGSRDDWDHEQWDQPVNQIHTVGTLILFSLIFTVGLQVLGFQFSRAERDAIFHFWRYVGWLMGIDPELLPTDESDSWRVAWLQAATELLPDEDSRRLAAALGAAGPAVHGLGGDGPLPRLTGRAITDWHATYSRLVLGGRNADLLGLPNRPAFIPAVTAVAAVNFVLESARRSIPGATTLSVRLGDRARRAFLRRATAATNPDPSLTGRSEQEAPRLRAS